MKRWLRSVCFICLLGLFHCSGDQGQPPPDEATEGVHDHDAGLDESAPRPEKLELPDSLLSTLRAEMQQIEAAMGSLLSQLAQAQAAPAAATARNIENTFILKQDLSEAALKQLVSLLPEPFLTLDRGFHENASKLATTAEQGDFRGAMDFYNQMSRACIDCHLQYATKRFPEFVKP